MIDKKVLDGSLTCRLNYSAFGELVHDLFIIHPVPQNAPHVSAGMNPVPTPP